MTAALLSAGGLVIRTGLLMAAVIALPAAWGWLVAAALRRCWPGPRVAPPLASAATDRDGNAVDFQI